jgi:hypothetical protein
LHFSLLGSCWAFSAVGAIEGVNAIETRKLINFSEQELLDCEPSGGCIMGWVTNGFDWIIRNQGIASANDYAYTGNKGVCKATQVLIFFLLFQYKNNTLYLIIEYKSIKSTKKLMIIHKCETKLLTSTSICFHASLHFINKIAYNFFVHFINEFRRFQTMPLVSLIHIITWRNQTMDYCVRLLNSLLVCLFMHLKTFIIIHT